MYRGAVLLRGLLRIADQRQFGLLTNCALGDLLRIGDQIALVRNSSGECLVIHR